MKESKSRKNIREGQSLEVHFKSEVMQSSGCRNRAGNGSIGLSHRQAARHSIYGESRGVGDGGRGEEGVASPGRRLCFFSEKWADP